MNWPNQQIVHLKAAALLFLITEAMIASQVATAQQPAIDLVPAESAIPAAPPTGLEANLQSLLETTRRVRERLVESDSSAKADSSWTTPTPMAVTEYGSGTNADETSTAIDNVNELRNRINLIRRLRRRGPSLTQKNPYATLPSRPIETDLPASMPMQPVATEPTLAKIQDNLQPQPATAAPDTPEPEVVSATEIFKQPVDSLALGESLYRTKNYTAAMQALKAVESDKLSESDRTWLELLIALCHRRMGDTETAEAQLREISNAKIADRSVPLARWWLKQTEMVQTAKPTLDAISQDLDTLIERSKTHVQ